MDSWCSPPNQTPIQFRIGAENPVNACQQRTQLECRGDDDAVEGIAMNIAQFGRAHGDFWGDGEQLNTRACESLGKPLGWWRRQSES